MKYQIINNIYEYDNTYHIKYKDCIKDLNIIINKYNMIFNTYKLIVDYQKKFFLNFDKNFYKYFIKNIFLLKS